MTLSAEREEIHIPSAVCVLSIVGDVSGTGESRSTGLSRFGTMQQGSGSSPDLDLASGGGPHPILHLVAGGMSLVDEEQLGILVKPDMKPRAVDRLPAVPWSQLRGRVPEGEREEADRLAGMMTRSGEVAGPVAARFCTLADMEAKRPEMARTWLIRAYHLDAAYLGVAHPEQCGAYTLEVVRRLRDGSLWHYFARHPCGSYRCAHCSAAKGRTLQARLSGQLQYDAAQGRAHPFFLTLTLDREIFAQSLGLSEALAKFVAIRRISYLYQVFVQKMRRAGYEVRAHRTQEFHASGWPHLHLIVSSPQLVSETLREAKEETVPDLLESMRKRRERHQASVRKWEAGGRQGPKPVARVPFRNLRQRIKAMAEDSGFGKHFWIEPMRSLDPETIARYLSKDPFSPVDRLPMDRLAGEVTKTSQRVGRLIPRGTRLNDGTRNQWKFFDVPEEEKGEEGETLSVAIHKAPIEAVRAQAEAAGLDPKGDLLLADQRGERPGKGERWPRQLAGFIASVPREGGLYPLPIEEVPPEDPDLYQDIVDGRLPSTVLADGFPLADALPAVLPLDDLPF